MNKIYKVIWSKTRNCYVAVSEIARNHGKDSVRSEKRGMFKGTFALALCIALSLGVTESVWAADPISGKALDIYGEHPNTVTPLNTGEAAAAIGRDNEVYGGQSLAIGVNNWIGINSTSSSQSLIDIPTSSTWNGFSSLAVGSANIVKGGFSIAIGETVRATGDYSFAQGVGSQGGSDYFPGSTAYGKASSAFNIGTLASGEGSTSHGRRTVAGGNYSAAYGNGSYAKGTGSFAVGTIGRNSIVGSSIEDINEYYSNKDENDANYRFYIPNLSRENEAAFSPIYNNTSGTYENYYKERPQTTAAGYYSAAFGAGAVAVGETAFTAGTGTTALGDYSVAFGSNSLARGDSSFAVGHSTYAVGNSSVAFNDSNFAIGYASAAFGNGTRAEGMRSVAMGNGTRAEGINAVAFGYDNTAGGQNSLAFGMGNKAYASRSVAFGSGTQAGAVEYDENGNPVFTYDYDGTKRYAVRGGEDSLAYGLNTKAFGDRSTASGTGTFASGEVSIASGNMTRALGQASSAGGSYTAAYGQNATSFGEYAHAIGKNTTAFGHYTTAGKRLQTEEEKALGIYTMVDPYTGEQTKVTKVNKLQYASMLTDANGNVVTDNDPNHLVDSVDRNYIIYHAKRSKNTSLYAIRVPIKDENGNPTGEYKIREVYQKPGDDTWYIYTEEEQAQREQDAGGKPTLLVNYDGVFVNDTSVKADNAVAFGNDTEAAAENALAFGDATLASNKRATAFGNHTVATGDSATSFGDTTLAAGRNATAFGESTVGTMQNATAFGQESAALAKNATAFGVRSKALGQASTTWGDESIAPGKYSTAFGEDSEAFAQDSAAWGSKTVAGVDKNDQAYKDYKDKLTELREKENQLKLLKKNGVTADILDADGNVESKGSISLEAEIREDEATLNTLYAKLKNLGKAATAFGENTNAIGTGSTAWGSKSVATGKYSTAFGESSKAYGQNSIAGLGGTTGTESTNATGAIAIGKGAVAQEANNIALGQKAKALGADSIVIGAVSVVKDEEGNVVLDDNGNPKLQGSTVTGNNSIAIGSGHTVSGNNSGAFGDPDVVEGDNSYVIGNNSTVSVDDAFILGNEASVTADGGVAIGTGSVASRGAESKTVDNTLENSIYGYDMKEKKAHVLNPGENESVWAPTAAAVSVGDTENNITRRITGVAAGSADTDAVNVAQLRAFVGESSSGGDGVHYYSTPEPTIEHEANYNNDGATGTYAMAAGVNTTATGNYATAIGGNAQADGEGNTVIGSNISTAGTYNTVTGTKNNIHSTSSFTPEKNTAVGTQNEINIGSHSSAYGYYNSIRGVTANYGFDPAEYSTAIGSLNTVYGQNSTALGYGNTITGNGDNSEISYRSTAIGANNWVYGSNNIALGGSNRISGLNNSDTSNNIAIGTDIEIYSDSYYNSGNNIAIGQRSKVTGYYVDSYGNAGAAWNSSVGNAVHDGMAIGHESKAFSNYATTVGPYSMVIGENSSAYGSFAKVYGENNNTAIGANSLAGFPYAARQNDEWSYFGANNTAVGASSIVGKGYNNVAVGTGTLAGYWSNYTSEERDEALRNAAIEQYGDVDGVYNEIYRRAGEVVDAQIASNLPPNYADMSDDEKTNYRNQMINSYLYNYSQTPNGNGMTQITNDILFEQWQQGKIQSDDYSTAVGVEAQAAGAGQTAVGGHSKALGWHATAVGLGSKAEGASAIAMGESAKTVGDSGIAIGHNSLAQNYSSIAMGTGAFANGVQSIAIGTGENDRTQTYGYRAVAVGVNAHADTTSSIAIGEGAKIDYDSVEAIKYNEDGSLAEEQTSHEQRRIAMNGIAVGQNARVAALDGTAVGRNTQAMMRNATAYGNNAHANGWNSVAIGNKAIAGLQADILNEDGTVKEDGAAIANSAIAIGNRAHAIAEYTTAVGAGTNAEGWHAVAVGDSNQATGKFSTAIGAGWSENYTPGEENDDGSGADKDSVNTERKRIYTSIGANQAGGDYSTAAGYGNKTVGTQSNAFGKENEISGVSSLGVGAGNKVGKVVVDEEKGGLLAEGQENTVSGYAVGSYNTITGSEGTNAGTFGAGNTVSGDNAYAIGNSNTVSGEQSIAVGNGHVVAGDYSGAFGDPNKIYANRSYALGNNNTIGVDGDKTKGVNTFVVGNNVTTTEDNTVVVGYHSEEQEPVHTFGKDSVSLGTDARAEVEGSVALGSGSIANREAGWMGVNPLNVPVTAQKLASPAWTSTDAAVSVGGGETTYTYARTNDKGEYLDANGEVVDSPEKAEQLTATAARTRQITNVAAGTKPTDAVNVAQLEGFATHYYSVNTLPPDEESQQDKVDGEFSNYTNEGATGAGALAAGYYTSAKGKEATALGNKSLAEGEKSVASGYKSYAAGESSTAYGVNATANNLNSVAIGKTADAYGEGAIALGHETTAGALVTVKEKEGTGAYTVYESNIHTQTIADGDNKGTYIFRNLKEKDDAGKTVVVAYNMNDKTYHTATANGNTYDVGSVINEKDFEEKVNMGGVAMGSYAHAEGNRSLALGRASGAYGEESSALGIYSNAAGDGDLAIGHGASTGVKADVVASGEEGTAEWANGFWTTSFKDKDGNPLVDQKGNKALDANGNPVSNGATGGIAIGSYSHTEGTRALAVGRVASAYGENSTAVGLRSSAFGEGSIAFGHGVVAGKDDEENKYAAQVKELHENPNLVYDLDGKDGKTYHDYDGHEKAIDPNNVIGAVAIGSYAEATGRGALSVGRYSEAQSAYTVAMGIRADAGVNSENAIAIGRETKVTAFETDENGNVKLDDNGKPVAKSYGGANSIAMGTMTSVNGQNSIAIGTADMIKDGEVVAPEERKATSVVGDSSIAIGQNDTIVGDNSIAIGTGHVINGSNSGAFGDPSYINDDNAYAIGNNNRIEEGSANSFVVGNNVTTTKENTVVFGNHSADNRHTFGQNSVSLGFDAVAKEADSVALGSTSVAKRKNRNGGGANDLTNTGFDVTTGTNYAGEDKTDPTWLSTLGAVSVGGAEKDTDANIGTAATQTRQITGVAAGTADTDAVNVAQLRLAGTRVKQGNNITVTSETSETGGTAYTVNGLKTVVTSTDKTVTVNGTGTPDEKGVITYDLSVEVGDVDTNTTYKFDTTKTEDTSTTNVVSTTKVKSSTDGQTYTETGETFNDTDTKYTGTQSVEGGTKPGEGSTTFNITNNNDNSSSSMTIQAGDNVTITKEETSGAAVINATDTTYTTTVTNEGLKEGEVSKLTITNNITGETTEFVDTDTDTTYTMDSTRTKEGTTAATMSITDSNGTKIGEFADTHNGLKNDENDVTYNEKGEGTVTITDQDGNTTTINNIVNTTYTAEQSVTAGENPGEGSTTFNITDNSGNDAGSMTINAGDNITITKDEKTGAAVINATDTTYSYTDTTEEAKKDNKSVVQQITVTENKPDGSTEVAKFTDTDTTYTVTSEAGKEGSNVVNKYTMTGTNGDEYTFEDTDTDTTYTMDTNRVKEGTTAATMTITDSNGTKIGEFADTHNGLKNDTNTVIYNENGEGTVTITDQDGNTTTIDGIKMGTDTTYTAEQSVTAGEKPGEGSTTFNITNNKGEDAGSMTINAGDNITITKDEKTGAAVINATDTTYSYTDTTEEAKKDNKSVVQQITVTENKPDGSTEVAKFTDTDTTYTVTSEAGKEGSNVVNKYTMTGTNGDEYTFEDTDTDTTYTMDTNRVKEGTTAATMTITDSNGTKIGEFADTHNGLNNDTNTVVYNDNGEGTVTVTDQDGNTTTINNIVNTTYTAEQSVTAGEKPGEGSTTFNITNNKGEDAGSMTINAGDNITITKDEKTGAAVINATDTTYSYTDTTEEAKKDNKSVVQQITVTENKPDGTTEVAKFTDTDTHNGLKNDTNSVTYVDGKGSVTIYDQDGNSTTINNIENTTYTITSKAGEEGSNVVNNYTMTGTNGYSYTFQDTDTDTDTTYKMSTNRVKKGTTAATMTITDSNGKEVGTFEDTHNGLTGDTYDVKYDENGVGSVTIEDQDGNTATITNIRSLGGEGVADSINYLGDRINHLDNKINKVGAGAAALAGLHPLDFDPDEKWDFSAAAGSYKGEHAVAIGAFYRPNEDTMFSVGGTIGNGNNMVNVGVSWKFGQKNRISANRISSAKEIIELRKNQEDVHSFLADAVAGNQLDLSKIQLFPDVEENHWAYDYVATMAGNGVLEGYPDGYFKGNRNMTRYEMAAVLYRLMQNGARLSDRALTEFAPELDRIRVDTITKHKDGTPHIQRVRTIKERVDEKADPSSEKNAKKKAKVKVAEKPVE